MDWNWDDKYLFDSVIEKKKDKLSLVSSRRIAVADGWLWQQKQSPQDL